MKELLANRVLNSLPAEDFARLLPHLEPVTLGPGEALCAVGDVAQFVYFPENVVVSHFHVLSDGGTVEAAMIGREGLVGLSPLLAPQPQDYWTQVTIPGVALRARAAELRQEFARAGELQRLVLGYANDRMAQMSQRVVCCVRHTVERRLCSWLLMLCDRTQEDQLPLTHELVASRLGIRRAGVTSAANALRDKGCIAYRRGAISILSRPALEGSACECYATLRLTAPAAAPPAGLNRPRQAESL